MTASTARLILYRMLLFSGVCGFEIAAAASSLAGIESTPVSVAVRATVTFLALVAILSDFGKVAHGSRRLILGFCLFWLLYIFRIAYSTTFSNEVLAYDFWYYYSWSIGACALPMLGISLWSPRDADANRNFLTLFSALSLGGVLSVFGASSVELNSTNQPVETGRLQLTALNPILLGQLGTTLFIMAVWALANRHRQHGRIAWVAYGIASLIGAGLLIASNSRGPLMSAAACLLFITLASSKRSRVYAILFLIIGIVSFVPATQYLEEEFGFSTYTRLFEQSQLTEENTVDRLNRFRGAIEAFSGSPVFGANLEEPTHGGYPHNLFLEAFMATGAIGGTFLFSLVACSLAYAVAVYRWVPAYGWASILFIQYLVAAQFSGAIYTATYLWVTAGLVISVHSSLAAPSRLGRSKSYLRENAEQPFAREAE
jgi:hypothetical protein